MAIAKLLKCRRGGVLLEFGLITPILVFMLLNGFEMARFLILNQKLQRAAMSVADLAARDDVLDSNDINNLFAAGNEVFQPFELDADGRVFLSSINEDGGGNPQVAWQRNSGTLLATSLIGFEGGAATLDEPTLIGDGQTLIVAEVFYDFEPLIGVIPGSRQVYHRAFYRPRLVLEVGIE